MTPQRTDGDYQVYTGALAAILILAPFYLAIVIWWWS